MSSANLSCNQLRAVRFCSAQELLHLHVMITDVIQTAQQNKCFFRDCYHNRKEAEDEITQEQLTQGTDSRLSARISQIQASCLAHSRVQIKLWSTEIVVTPAQTCTNSPQVHVFCIVVTSFLLWVNCLETLSCYTSEAFFFFPLELNAEEPFRFACQ